MIYVIMGPTSSGKTKAACRLSDVFDAPIINADAFQIYQGMNIATGKIDENDPYFKKHFLLNILTPDQTYSVKRYQDDFRRIVKNDNKNYIVCGGTGLYIRAALFDYQFEENDDDISDLEKLSNEELILLLQSLDPESLTSIHQNNRKRVIRAISIARSQSKTKTENINSQTHSLIYDNVRFLFINPERDSLYEKINNRVDVMFYKGILDETKNLLKNYNLSMTAREAIGYKECIAFINGELTLQEAKEKIKQRSRNYAKRQVTFFKHQFKSEEFASADELIKEFCHE